MSVAGALNGGRPAVTVGARRFGHVRSVNGPRGAPAAGAYLAQNRAGADVRQRQRFETRSSGGGGWRFLLILLVLLIVGGGVFLSQWDIAPPEGEIEIVIPNDRFVN